MIFEGKTAVVTGASRGLGRAVAARLAGAGARVVAVARNKPMLTSLAESEGVEAAPGDVTDAALAERVLTDARPDILVLNAGALGPMQPVQDFTWEDFSVTWETDVRGTLVWCQQAMRLPLRAGSHVVVVSSGAAIHGASASGGYAGAKRMQWLLTNYFRQAADDAGLGLRFSTVLPTLTGDTDLSRRAVESHAKHRGVTPEQFLEGMGTRLTSEGYARHFVEFLVAPEHAAAQTVMIRGDGIAQIEPSES